LRAPIALLLLLAAAVRPGLSTAAPPDAATASLPLPGASGPWDVLLILADDLGTGLGAYGDSAAGTPNLDTLASRGIRFDTAWVTQASCSPSRASVLTGLFPHANGQYGLTQAKLAMHDSLRTATLPAMMRAGGVRTGVIGKLHVAPVAAFPFEFRRAKASETFRVRRVAEHCRDFFAGDDGRPSFLMVCMADPHAIRVRGERYQWRFETRIDGLPETPVAASEVAPWPWLPIDDPEELDRIAGYRSAVRRLDAGVGLVLAELEAAGRTSRTVVIFASDNGPGFVRAKATCYEPGLRVPLLVLWPGLQPGSRAALVSLADLAPTILEALGLPVPDGLHGCSLRPLLLDASAPWRTELFAEFHLHDAGSYFPRRAVRDARYKLIENLLAGRRQALVAKDGDPAAGLVLQRRYAGTLARALVDRLRDPPAIELYDLETDPHEIVNLAGRPETASVEDRLRAALLGWRRETADPFLDPAFLESFPPRQD
jgi:N-sulfoglucosamine sulfohydrolase